MNDSHFTDASLGFVEAQYARWLDDPGSVEADWRGYFDALEDDLEPSARARSAKGPTLGVPSLFDPDRPIPGNGAAADPSSMAADSAAAFDLLRCLSVFREVPDLELQAVADIVRELQFADGAVVFQAGDPGNEMFVVLAGSVLIRRDAKVVAELEVGEVVGEMAVLDGLPRSADAVARGDVRLLRLGGDELLALLDRRPALARGILRTLTQRIRDSSARQDQLDQLIRAYRVRGHLIADLDPLGLHGEPHPELAPEFYGFGPADMGRVFSSRTIPGTEFMTLDDILAHLRRVYCRSIGVQYMHIDDLDIKMWIQSQLEGPGRARSLSRAEQLQILTKLTDAEIFEQFIHRKFLGAKRFSLEGAESLIPLLDMAVEEAGEHGVDEIVIGMAHRGRINVLANVLEKSPRQIFREFDDSDPEKMLGSGDVKYHLGYSSDRVTVSGKRVHLTLCFNPSHLEFVGPVVLGRVRAKQDRFADTERRKRMGIVIHGDSAFAGQGVVQEVLNMSGLPGYTTGGTLHIIVNNQIGFTTPPERARSTQYCTDVAKMLQVPIFHVNGEHPEAVARVIQLALDFRRAFQRDVVVDMYCYRRYGHNETDEPAFTQPLMYEAIRKRKSVREGYCDNLLALGELTAQDTDRIAVERRQVLEDELTAARSPAFKPLTFEYGKGFWKQYSGGADQPASAVETAVPLDRLKAVMLGQSHVPEGFTPHRKIAAVLEGRKQVASGERPVDWAAAEALAIGTLLAEGYRVRFTGQDVGRGTFSHRHAVIHDSKTGRSFVPLQQVAADGTVLEIHDSPLTETGVLGFEYGYSLDMPDALCLWEAQFGDFVNVAQVIIDQFLCSGEDKWRRLSALALLLPHGYEGQGPEHSSARLERFLALSAEDNMRVVNLTSPAQVFHCLRRQGLSMVKKPLVVMSPKSLLRHPKAISGLDELAAGRFQTIIGDPAIDPARARRVLLTSGKIYYELEAHRAAGMREDVAIVRMEQYHPLDLPALTEALADYREGTPVVWVQEEPLNMGAWGFLKLQLDALLPGRFPLTVVARDPSASPATGSAGAHKIEQADLIARAFAV